MMLPYGLILSFVHLTEFSLCYSSLNVLSVFGYSKYSSVTNMLFERGLPSFNTVIHNSKVSLLTECQSVSL